MTYEITQDNQTELAQGLSAAKKSRNFPTPKYANQITCATLFYSPSEWIGVDIDTGSFVRNSRYLQLSKLPVSQVATKEKTGGKGKSNDRESKSHSTFTIKKFTLLELNNPAKPDPVDPSRPEAIETLESISLLGQLPYRKVKKLLKMTATKKSTSGKILGNFGPSIAFMDLEAVEPSVALIDITKSQMEIILSETNDMTCVFEWGGTIQKLPLADGKYRQFLPESGEYVLSKKELTKLLGGKVTHLLIGLYRVQNGHVPKVVMSVIAPKRRRG